jgi:serine/threonine protein kinase/Tfp pilus assembly protein PilF
MHGATKQVTPAMNEDPTTAIGAVGGKQNLPAEQAEAPAAAATWGSFSLMARVGFGGFGEVYRAWDPHLQREVALKLLLPGMAASEGEYEAMLREARALASVRHPNIVPVYGIDRHDGRVGFWTDFVRGKTLSVLVGEQGTFGAREAALIGLDVARALSAVHRAGMLHRDIKAENVMREEGGRILLMDFGLSALEQRQTNIAGTPNYMAPELFAGGHATVATDIYAMGVLLYFLVAGDYPARLSGLTTKEALDAFPARRPLMDLRPDLPESLLRTVSTAMEMDPAKRFTSAGQLASALAESLGTHVPADTALPSNQRQPKRIKREWLVAGAILAAALVFGVLPWRDSLRTLLHRSGDSSLAPSSTGKDEFTKAQDLLLRSYKESNLAEAVKGFQSVLKADPTNALAAARLGAAYLAQHGYTHDPHLLDLARESSNRAIALQPELAAPYITLASIAALERDTDQATMQVKKALSLEPKSAEAHGAQGEVYEAQSLMDKAITEYKQASDLAPDDWRWPMSLGVAYFRQGKLQEAIAQLQHAVDLDPNNAEAFYDLSIAHRQSGQLEQARKDLDQALKLDPTAKNYAALGALLLFQGQFEKAAEMGRKAIQLDPNNYMAYEDLGAAYSWSGTNHDKAVQAYRKAIELEEADNAKKQQPWQVASLADDYAAVGDRNKSLVLARKALALDANDPFVNYKTGEAFEVLGQREAAIPLIARAVANGYNVYEFEHSPELAALRNDPKFIAALNALKERKQ